MQGNGLRVLFDMRYTAEAHVLCQVNKQTTPKLEALAEAGIKRTADFASQTCAHANHEQMLSQLNDKALHDQLLQHGATMPAHALSTNDLNCRGPDRRLAFWMPVGQISQAVLLCLIYMSAS